MELTYAALKGQQRAMRDDHDPSFGLRTHRALSWLQRAEQDDEDDDARFISLCRASTTGRTHKELAFRVRLASGRGDKNAPL